MEIRNIQFMTAEANGIETGEYRWNGKPDYKYIPNYDVMIARASCEEEVEAIRRAREFCKDGFAFEIVFTTRGKRLNPDTLKWDEGWTVYQHPWYEDDFGNKVSKEDMLKTIETYEN